MSGSGAVWDVYESPLGPLVLQARPAGLSALFFPGGAPALDEGARDPATLAGAARQLEEFFAGSRRAFDLPLDLDGTPFQQRVWHQLQQIPYGMTTTYGELARAVGKPDIVRSVAGVIAKTPVPIVVPCHRVIAASGALTGYLGGLHRKHALLELERRGVNGDDPEPSRPFHQLALL